MDNDKTNERTLLLGESGSHLAKSPPYSATAAGLSAQISHYNVDRNIDDDDDAGQSTHAPMVIIQQDRSFMEHTTTNMQALMHLLKGNIGTGILAMPNAFLSAGLWVGFGGVLTIGVIAIHCMHILVNCSHKLCARTSTVALDYAGVAEMAMKTGPMPLRRAASAAWIIVNGFLLLTQIGFCCVYIVFIADNVQQVIHHFHSNDPDTRVYMVIIMVLLIPYVFVKQLTFLSIFSGFANLLTVTGLVIIFQYIFRTLPSHPERPVFNSTATMPLFFGTAMFAFEGIGVILPIENTMKNPEDLPGYNGVLNLGMVTVTALYTALGFYGYLNFGEHVRGSITLSLPVNNWLYLSVRLLFAVAIFITYGLQYYVPIEIIWPPLRSKISSRRGKVLGEYILRISLVICTFGVAVGIPHLDLLISLIGALASSCLALIFPPFIEIITLYGVEGKRPSLYIIVKNLFIMCIGLVGFISGTFTSLKVIISTF